MLPLREVNTINDQTDTMHDPRPFMLPLREVITIDDQTDMMNDPVTVKLLH